MLSFGIMFESIVSRWRCKFCFFSLKFFFLLYKSILEQNLFLLLQIFTYINDDDDCYPNQTESV